MPIEFPCTGCGKLMRAADAAAGRKGQCPHCGTLVPIPSVSTAGSQNGGSRPSSPAAAPRVAPPSPPRGTMQFDCGRCRRTLSVPAANAGKKGKCPHCGAVMTIPAASATAAPPATSKWTGGPAPAAAPIEFACPFCNRTVRFAGSAAGQTGKCPHCASTIKVPVASAASAKSAALPGASGLAPLTDLGPDDPLAGLPDLTASPGGPAGSAAGPALGPYAGPILMGPSKPYRPAHENKPPRTGLPWDNRELHESPFWATVKRILFSPNHAFYTMHRQGGVGGPLLFCIRGMLFGGAVALAYYLLLPLAVLAAVVVQRGGEQMTSILLRILIFAGIYAAAAMVSCVCGAIVCSFLYAGAAHLFLLLFGGAEQPFETTYRVVCYALGAAAVCNVLPVCGGLIWLVASVVLLILGIYAGHETSGLKAVGAVLLPFAVSLALAVVTMMVAMTVLSGATDLVHPPAV